MPTPWKELIIQPTDIDLDELLQDWRWLIPEHHSLVVLSALGDLFLESNDGAVFWLDTGTGSFTKIAENADQFQALAHQPDHLDDWFRPQLISDLQAQGIKLGNHQCYSFKIPPWLGGKIEPGNFEPTDLSVHFSILGQLLQQVKDLPSGTRIKGVHINRDGA